MSVKTYLINSLIILIIILSLTLLPIITITWTIFCSIGIPIIWPERPIYLYDD